MHFLGGFPRSADDCDGDFDLNFHFPIEELTKDKRPTTFDDRNDFYDRFRGFSTSLPGRLDRFIDGKKAKKDDFLLHFVGFFDVDG